MQLPKCYFMNLQTVKLRALFSDETTRAVTATFILLPTRESVTSLCGQSVCRKFIPLQSVQGQERIGNGKSLIARIVRMLCS